MRHGGDAMKYFPRYAVSLLLFLLLFLLGALFWLRHTQKDSGGPRQGESWARHYDPYQRDWHTGTDQTPLPAERPPEAEGRPAELRHAQPPEGRQITRREPDVEAVVEALPLPEVQAEEEDFDLEPLIVSTLAPLTRRSEHASVLEEQGRIQPRHSHAGALIHKRGDAYRRIIPDLFPELPWMLVGRLEYPELPKSHTETLISAHRMRAIVYLEDQPLMRDVAGPKGWFVLHLTERQAGSLARQPARLVVHSPAFRVRGGADHGEVFVIEAARRQPLVVPLELTPQRRVQVSVSPSPAPEENVRVWLERRGDPDGPDHDDSLFMSARVPPSGRLAFLVPERYGELRVGATGEYWHSGQAGVVNTKWQDNLLRVNLRLQWERCQLLEGVVTAPAPSPVTNVETIRKSVRIPGVSNGNARANNESRPQIGTSAYRFERTGTGATIYTDEEGRFRSYFHFPRGEIGPQLVGFHYALSPTYIPLTLGADPPRGVANVWPGAAVLGPWRVAVEPEVGPLKLGLPGVPAEMATYIGWREEYAYRRTRAAASGEDVPWEGLRWRDRFVHTSSERGEQQRIWFVPRSALEEAWWKLQEGDEAPTVTLVPLSEALSRTRSR
jgi:hypothetical protein